VDTLTGNGESLTWEGFRSDNDDTREGARAVPRTLRRDGRGESMRFESSVLFFLEGRTHKDGLLFESFTNAFRSLEIGTT
jgi:hypothetical protein